MAYHARRIEANAVARKAREGVPAEEIIAAQQKVRADFGVTGAMVRLFSGPVVDQHDV